MNRPPRLARWLIAKRVPAQSRSFLLGDLEEAFARKAVTSPVRARLWYWRQALSALMLPFPGVVGVETGPAAGGWGRDVSHALRGMRRSPGQALTAIVTLGLGIGVVGTAFSILWGTVLKGLPFEEAEQLVHFERADLSAGRTSMAVTPHDYVAWREAQRSFEDLGAYVEATALIPNEQAPPDRLVGVRISATSFELLRVAPAMGRVFSPSDEEPGAPHVIVLSHRTWENRFASETDVVGRSVIINGSPTTVIGVMPERFGFPIAEEFWLPLRLDFSSIERGSGRLDVFGRLAPGQDIHGARRDFERITTALSEAHPGTNGGITAQLRTFSDEYVGAEFRNTVLRLGVGALIVLLICCANVANLLLIRGVRRRTELAVRMSLGATHGLIARQLLVETTVLATLGAVVGVGMAGWGVRWFNRVGARAGVFDLPHGSDSLFWWEVGLDGPTMIVVLGVSVATALLAGAVPALRAADAANMATRSHRGGAGGPGRLTAALIVLQLALTGGLTVAGAFVTKSIINVAESSSGFDSAGVYVTRVDLPGSASSSGSGYADHAARWAFVRSLLDALEADPSVSAATATTDVPTDPPISIGFEVEGEFGDAGSGREAGVVSVTPGYFDIFDITPSAGRVFDLRDSDGGSPVALVNETFVRLYLPEGSPVGKRIQLGPAEGSEPWLQVVGVIPDMWERPGSPEREAGIYVPLSQAGLADPAVRLGGLGLRYPTVAVALREGGSGAVDVFRRAVFGLDSTVPVRGIQAMSDFVAQRTDRYQVWGRFYLAFSALALLLVAVGIYGVLSFGVATRTAEIGVRRALGASGAAVQRQIMSRALRQIALGVVGGVAVGMLMVGGLTRVLYGVDTSDLRVFVGASLLLGAVGLMASWIPARRASRIDPLEAIRSE